MTKKEGLNQFTIWGAFLALGAGAYFLIRGLKPKSDITIQYQDDRDKAAAELIKAKLNPKHYVFGYVDADIITSPLVCVGGPFVNDVTGHIATNTGVRDLTSADAGKGFIFTRTYRAIKVWLVYGWLQQDTIRAAEWISKNGLPTSDGDMGV